MSKIQLGIAPIAWTNDDMPDLGKENTFEQCVSEMALAGFTGCEVGGRYPRDTAVLQKALELRGMRIASAWFSSFLLTQPYEQVEKDFIAHCSFLKKMGAKFCNVAEQGNSVQGKLDVPVFAGKPENTAEQWKLLTEGLDKLGKVAADMEMTMTYHHHMGTGVQTEAEIDRLMENTNPDYVWLLYDTGHLVCSGEDYMGILKKYMSRIRHIHLKDSFFNAQGLHCKGLCSYYVIFVFNSFLIALELCKILFNGFCSEFFAELGLILSYLSSQYINN